VYLILIGGDEKKELSNYKRTLHLQLLVIGGSTLNDLFVIGGSTLNDLTVSLAVRARTHRQTYRHA
jgi:hypothetical protein